MGFKWPVVGSTGTVYLVEMKEDGFVCSCPAFKRCKHIDATELKIAGD